MEFGCKGCFCFYKLLSVIYIIFNSILFVVVNVIMEKDDQKASRYFLTIFAVDISLIARFYIAIMVLISGISDYAMKSNFFVVGVSDFAVICLFAELFVKKKGEKGDLVIFVVCAAMLLLDIIFFIPYSRFSQQYNDTKNCIYEYYKNKKEKISNKIDKKLNSLNGENSKLKQENNELLEIKIKRSSLNVEEQKVQIILWYIKNKYNVNLPTNILYKYLLDEVKQKCGLTINNNSLKKVFLKYIYII